MRTQKVLQTLARVNEDASLPEEECLALMRQLSNALASDLEEAARLLRGMDLASQSGAELHCTLVEALAMKTEIFGTLLLEELRRVQTYCEAEPRRAALRALDTFGDVDIPKTSAHHASLLHAHLKGLESKWPELRAVSLGALADFVESEEALREIGRRLQDPSWRVRFKAESILKREGKLSATYRPPWLDVVQRMLRGTKFWPWL